MHIYIQLLKQVKLIKLIFYYRQMEDFERSHFPFNRYNIIKNTQFIFQAS